MDSIHPSVMRVKCQTSKTLRNTKACPPGMSSHALSILDSSSTLFTVTFLIMTVGGTWFVALQSVPYISGLQLFHAVTPQNNLIRSPTPPCVEVLLSKTLNPELLPKSRSCLVWFPQPRMCKSKCSALLYKVLYKCTIQFCQL